MAKIIVTVVEASRDDEGLTDLLQSRYDEIGEVSDGYHTFDELYHYRALYNAAFFNESKYHAGTGTHKSRFHSDGEPCFGGGWFIVMTYLPTGQISNHYEDKYWDLFQIEERIRADEWDGHTPKDVADRLEQYLRSDLSDDARVAAEFKKPGYYQKGD